METHANIKSNSDVDGGGDCQTAAAAIVTDTTAPRHVIDDAVVEKICVKSSGKELTTITTAQKEQQQKLQQQKVTTAANNNNNNKLNKQQQQQQQQQQVQQQQQQPHQFRAPQQFVKHKKCTPNSALSNNNNNNTNGNVNKKGKTWNKRQHKNSAKQQQQHQRDNNKVQVNTNTNANTNISNSIGSNNVGNVCNLSSGQASGVLSSTKADLENSQNLKNQISTAGAVGGCGTANGGGNGVGVANNHQHTHHYQQNSHHYSHHNNNHHHHQQQQQQQQLGLGPVGNGVPSSVGLTNSEKLGYGHGHMKQQQTHKKILTHRGHHHHVLCAAHNNNVNVNGITNCCLATNQNGKEAKDTGLNNSIGKCVTSVRHFCCARAKFFLPEKRPRKEIIIPPTKFLLGGNISDPLNLNSLQNETSASNTPATTPRRSPITTPPKVEVIIPPNIHDPLHLLDPVDSMEYEKQLTSPMKRGGLRRGLGLLHSMPHFNKHRHRKNRKPKRRRHESHNSSISSTVMGSGLATSDEISSLSNNKLTTAPATVVEAADSQQSNNSSAIDYSEERKENITTTCSIVAHLEHNESNKETNSPTSGVVGEAMAVSTCGVGSHIEQQHVAGDMLLQQERLNRSDLRLDLHSTSSSTCGSTFSGSRISNGGGGGGGRKRRISESNASQKNKKFYRMDSMDKIVSPVVPQPGAWKRMPILATGARKPAKRTTSTSEIELLSPVDESMKSISIEESLRIETTDVIKLESMPESGLGSPLSTISGATSVAAGEQDSTVGENEINEEVTPVKEVNASKAVIANENKLPKFRLDGKKYRYGNYDRYAGFRHLNGFMDVRLQVFQRYVELFQGKDILDIGCNVGQMTISVAQNLAPQSILGIDIDFGLIAQARRNLSLYVRIPSKIQTQAVKQEKLNKVETKIKKKRRKNRKGKLNQQQPQQQQQHHNSYHHHHHQQQQQQQQQHGLFCCNNGGNIKDLKVSANEFFPRSFALNYGGIPHATETVTTATATKTNSNTNTNSNNKTSTTTTATTTITNTTNNFPRNVFFQQSNYVLKDESLLVNDTQQYDLILCLSVTKWIHLNFGDAGLKLAFKRIFNQLRPGGKLILEAQNWASYKKKKNLTEEIYNNYRNIEFFPNKFHEYLLSSEVGFSHSYTLGVPRHMNKGFCRPIQLYAKGDYTPNHVRWSDAHYPQTPYEAYRGIYADMPPRPPALCYPTSMASSRSHAYDTPHYTGASSGPYSCRQTPMHQPTSQYYNPLETDSYQPSYDMEYLNHMYVFASPLYQTVWSPPASLRKSSSHTPLFGSVREAELDGECSGGGSGGYYPRHVYPPNEDTSSPNANMGGAFNSIHEVDTDDSNHPPGGGVRHVYATTHCGESSSSPQVNHHENELNEAAIISDEDAVGGSSAAYCDFTEQ